MPHSVKVTKCACNSLGQSLAAPGKCLLTGNCYCSCCPAQLRPTASKKLLLDPQAALLSDLTHHIPTTGRSLEVLAGSLLGKGPEGRALIGLPLQPPGIPNAKCSLNVC